MSADQNLLNALVAQIAEQVTQEVCERIREQAPAILQGVMAEYPHAAPRVEEERLLTIEEVAERLGCGKQLVVQRMSSGQIIWTVEAGTGDRKVKRSRLEEYIKNLPEYTGRKSDARPVEG